MTDITLIVQDIWKTVLDVDQILLEDDFFELGGDSLAALAMASELCEQLLSPSRRDEQFEWFALAVYEHPSVKSFAAAVALIMDGATE